eukprot:SAG31_NODE_17744_length_659_cov_1.183929_1_plen_26_part_10
MIAYDTDQLVYILNGVAVNALDDHHQ